MQQDPSLKGKAFGVGQGVLTTASVGADLGQAETSTRLERLGVARVWLDSLRKSSAHISFCKSEESGAHGRTPLHFDLYIAASKSVREVLLQYDENLMMASLDEGYLK